MPWGLLEEETAQLAVPLGSSATTRDFMVAPRPAWGPRLHVKEPHALERSQLTMDTGPESRGVRTQFWPRRVPGVETSGNPLQVRDSPPEHSKYHPIARWWGIVALPWHGTLVHHAATRRAGAKSLTWQGLKPVVALSRKVSAPGVTRSKRARHAVEARLERNPLLPKWDIVIHPLAVT